MACLICSSFFSRLLIAANTRVSSDGFNLCHSGQNVIERILCCFKFVVWYAGVGSVLAGLHGLYLYHPSRSMNLAVARDGCFTMTPYFALQPPLVAFS